MSLLPQPVMSFGTDFAFAEAYFTETTTTTPVAVYQDSAYAIPYASPVVANAVGRFPAIYVNPALGDARVRIILAGGDLGDPEIDIDPLNVLFGLGGVTNAFLADAPGGTLKGNLTGGTGPVTDNNQASVSDFIRYATETEQGVITLATLVEALAHTNNAKAITPLTLSGVIDAEIAEAIVPFAASSTLAAKGHYIFPGGLILNWDTVAPGDDAQVEYTMDHAFTTAFYGAVASVKYSGVKTGGNGGGATWYPSGLDKIKVGIAWDGDSTGITDVFYMALGK